MSDPADGKRREPATAGEWGRRLAKLGIRPVPAGPKPFRSRRYRFDQDENIFSKRKPTDTDKTK